MRGPPGSRAPRFLPPREGEQGGSPGAPGGSAGSSSAGGGAGARPPPKKASRLLLYLRLRQRELLRLVALVGSSLLLLLLVVWLLVAFSDGTEPENQSSEEVKLNGGLVPPHRRSRFRRRGTGRHFFSRHPRRSGGGAEAEDSGEAQQPLMPLVRSPFASHPRLAQGVSTGLMAGQGTDVYQSYRDGEILGRWDRQLGLEVDVWDPRTHDPNHPGGCVDCAPRTRTHVAGHPPLCALQRTGPCPSQHAPFDLTKRFAIGSPVALWREVINAATVAVWRPPPSPLWVRRLPLFGPSVGVCAGARWGRW